jgi:hypothetical protein
MPRTIQLKIETGASGLWTWAFRRPGRGDPRGGLFGHGLPTAAKAEAEGLAVLEALYPKAQPSVYTVPAYTKDED